MYIEHTIIKNSNIMMSISSGSIWDLHPQTLAYDLYYNSEDPLNILAML